MNDRDFWILAFLFFGVLDLATTYHGLQQPGVVEANPVADWVLEEHGFGGMIVLKAGAFAAAYLGYKIAPEEYRAGVPIGLALLGLALVANNRHVIRNSV